MQAIHTAYNGRMKMLRAVFGGEEPAPRPPPKPTLSLGRQIALLAQNHKAKGGPDG
jgi:hypothetical protein